MRSVLPFRGALLHLCLLFSFTAAAHNARMQEITAVAATPRTTPGTPSSTSAGDGQTTTILPTSSVGSATLSSTPSSALSTTPTPTEDVIPTLFNTTLPEDQLPLEPQLTPGWAVSGTILIATGITFALDGVRARRVQTFFSTASLAALGTTVLILYLMTPPVSNAVQGAFVVAAVGTGAALGGLAVLFQDLAECLGCLLGGFCLSMWLLTLRPGGLVRNFPAKVVFIAVFTCAGAGMYFSRWTRAYGLVGCIAFAGATAAVLGVDCFSRAGLKEFWAYVWALNDDLFPDGADSYPLTRGIRVELAVTIILAVLSVISQLRLWRLVQKRRDKGKEKSSEETVVLPDEEEGIRRRVGETTARERREWERVYGGGWGVHDRSLDSGVGDMESERPAGHSERTSITSISKAQALTGPPDGELPAEPPESTPGQSIVEKDAGDGRVIVRVVEDDMPDRDMVHSAVQEKGENLSHEISAPTTRRSSESGQAPPIVPLPFKIPALRAQEDKSVAAGSEQDDKSSVVAVADGEDDPAVSTQLANTEGLPRMWRNSVYVRRNLLQRSAEHEEDNWVVAAERYEEPALTIKTVEDDLDSVIATLDNETSSEDADTAALDWPPESPEDSVVEGRSEVEKEQQAGTDQESTPAEPPADEVKGDGTESPVLGDPNGQTLTDPPSVDALTSATEAGETGEDKPEEAAKAADETPPDTAGAPGLTAPESVGSVRTEARRLTKFNLPPALPDVAQTYRTNEWAKHLSIAETPEPEALRLSGPSSDPSDEEPAHLDIAELQRTVLNGAPPPAAPMSSSAVSNHAPHARTTSWISLPDSGRANFAPSAYYGSQPWDRPGSYRSSMMQHQSWALLAQPIAEEDGEDRSISGVQRTEVTQSAQPADSHRHSTLDAVMQPTGAYAHAKPQTLIGMREMLLRSRASYFAPLPNETSSVAINRPAASDAGSPRNQPLSTTSDVDPDDLPLSQRRALIRQSSLPVRIPVLVPQPQPTAESTPFNSHQPTRHSTVPPESVRQAQLAQFRHSVAADLRAAAPPPRHSLRRMSSSAATLLNLNSNSNSLDPTLSSRVSLLSTSSGFGGAAAPAAPGESKGDGLRSMELQRSILLKQKEMEMRSREAEAVEKGRYDREFEERMRSGLLMGVHRDAMRRLQGGVKA